ncbi:hypothetical protein SK128_017687 [Halocaridina rubra]|uniref:Uncharacterized protein n=1 Tax=Halocaridina rubra TaxID=373956 RepID=A0AAN9A0K3_HALRR
MKERDRLTRSCRCRDSPGDQAVEGECDGYKKAIDQPLVKSRVCIEALYLFYLVTLCCEWREKRLVNRWVVAPVTSESLELAGGPLLVI